MSLPGKRWVRVTIAALVVGGALIGSLAYLMHFALASPSPPRFAAPGDSAEANRQDLAYARDALHEMDRSFSGHEFALFDRQLDELTQRAAQLDPAALEMQIAKAVALSGNGHTNLLGAMRGLTLNSIALRFYWFDDGLRLIAADPAYAELLGAKVLQVGGRAPEELVRLVGAYVGGSPSLARELAIYPMESPQALHAIGLMDAPDAVNLVLQLSDGQVVERSIPAVPMPAAGPPPEQTPQSLIFDRRELHWPRRELSPVPLPSDAPYPQPLADGRTWTHVLNGRAMAFTLQQPNRFYWSTYLAGSDILFLQMNTIMDEPGQERLGDFLQKVFTEARTKKPRFAIVDLRWNPGGSYQHIAAFTKQLPQLIPADGRLFILTSGNTFSAGIVTTARLKYFAGARSTILGEPVGDYSQFWAEAAARIVLPNSGIRIGYATGYHDWQHGCSLADVLVCYPPNYGLGVAAGDLSPTVEAPWSFADYVAGRDTAVERVLGLVRTAAQRPSASGSLL